MIRSAKPGYLIIYQIEHFQIKETTTLIMELSVQNEYESIKNNKLYLKEWICSINITI